MRTKFAGFALLLALGIAIAATVTGQEEPLPPVYTRGIALEPSVVLPVEPVRSFQEPTLADAARGNDYLSFHALYQETSPAEYRTLHELWTWAINDPIGAFYGRDMHDRLARAYPGYASYIENFRIVDQRGNVFYPTSETRTFLLQRAIEKDAPRVQLATKTPMSAADTGRTANTSRAAKPRSTSAVAPKRTTSTHTRSAAPTPKKTSLARTTVPATVAETPKANPASVATTAATSTTTAPAASTPATSAPAASIPVDSAPVTTAPATTAAPVTAAPVTTTPEEPVATAPVPPTTRTPNSGILLLVIGLIGVGLLALILRTPREAQSTSILQPQPPAESGPKAAAPVEPIRRPGTPAAEDPKKSQATGSHG